MVASVNVSFKFNRKTHSGISTRGKSTRGISTHGISKRYPSQLTIHLDQYQDEIFEEGRGFSTSINDIYGGGRGF